MGKFDQLKIWIKRYGLCNVIIRSAKMILPVQRIENNKRLCTVNWQAYCKKKLKKYLIIKDEEIFDDS